nr:MAG TPA: minor capsid protein [Caudoviricetes sp.]
MKNPSKKYWEDRAAERMVSYTSKAESTADTLGKAYYATARYLQGEANDVFNAFTDKFELSIAEAETMLKNAPNKSMFEQMKTALATCTDEQRKQELETLLSSPAYAHRIGRLNDLDSKISDMCSRLANAEIGVDTAHLGDIIQRAYMQTVFDVTKGADYRAAFDLIPESRVKAILSTNWSGQMFSQRVWDNTNALADGLKHDMLVGIMAGKSEQHMADDIMNRCGVGAFEARRLVRTETTCVANMAELYGYKELDIDEYEFSACLDSRTSDLCRELDGKVFKRNSAQAGVNLPPMHPFCRSTTLPVLPSEEDLDKELAELGDEIGADVDFDEWERNLQQGEDGKWRYVAGSAGKPMRFAGNGVDKSKGNGIINIEFDEFVPCLKDAETGEIFQTEVRELTKSEYSRFKEADGWNIDWSDIPDGEQVLGVYLKNDTEPQGLIAIRKDKGGVYLSYASTAPINNKLFNNGKQKFIGVGGHLFAAAIEESVKAGNETGCIYGYAANQEVLNHYIENFGAVHLPITHEYQFIIDGEAAEQILSKYNFERI